MRRILLLIAPLLAHCSSGGNPTAPAAILDPSSNPFGKSYSDWAVGWYQWSYGFHIQDAATCVDPIRDTTGAVCAVSQDAASPVFYLTGTYGTPAHRSACVVPHGRALFFPLVNNDQDNVGVDASKQVSEATLQSVATTEINSVVTSELSLTVDGVAYSGLEKLRAATGKFSYTLPAEPNYYTCVGVTGITGSQGPSYADGYWVMLAPLAAGAHTVEFHAHQGNPDFHVDVVYDLTVQ